MLDADQIAAMADEDFDPKPADQSKETKPAQVQPLPYAPFQPWWARRR